MVISQIIFITYTYIYCITLIVIIILISLLCLMVQTRMYNTNSHYFYNIIWTHSRLIIKNKSSLYVSMN